MGGPRRSAPTPWPVKVGPASNARRPNHGRKRAAAPRDVRLVDRPTGDRRLVEHLTRSRAQRRRPTNRWRRTTGCRSVEKRWASASFRCLSDLAVLTKEVRDTADGWQGGQSPELGRDGPPKPISAEDQARQVGKVRELSGDGTVEPVAAVDQESEAGQVGERGRRVAPDLIVAEVEKPRFPEGSQFARNLTGELIGPEQWRAVSTEAIGDDAVSLTRRVVTRPAATICPIRTVGGVA